MEYYKSKIRTFIKFKSERWSETKDILEKSPNTFEELVGVIQTLRNLNWGIRSFRNLDFLALDVKESLLEVYNWVKPYILTLPDNYIEDISELYPHPYIEIPKKKCLGLLGALFFGCSKVTHSFFDEQDIQKCFCMISYFQIIKKNLSEQPEYLDRILSIEIKRLNNSIKFEDWTGYEEPLLDYEIDPVQKIEDYPQESIKIDFANKYIGGGVLNGGCVQEEILFSIYPELLISMILCPVMEENEAIAITGAIRAANYTGYAWGFRFHSESNENIEIDHRKRVKNTFVAIDALVCFNIESQFTPDYILRELNKAYIGFFKNFYEEPENLVPVVTGKWGCGEFGGFPPLKILLQWIAASKVGRKTIITTFGDQSLIDLREVMEKYQRQPIKNLLNDILRVDPRYYLDLFDVLLGKTPKERIQFMLKPLKNILYRNN
jgi:Poly (ADP-ribose) glycohydrolase (PARG)